MKQITILACDNAWGMSVMCPRDFFTIANFVCQKHQNTCEKPYFSIDIVTVDGAPAKSANQSVVVPDKSIEDVIGTDVIIIPAIRGDSIINTIEEHASIICWLKDMHAKGAILVSFTTGSFFLAESGLLDGKQATTHWAFSSIFEKRYPNVNINPEIMITDAGNIFCTGGTNSGFYLLAHLLEMFCGEEIARECSLYSLMDMPQSVQTVFIGFTNEKLHQDKEIHLAQQWMEENYFRNSSMDKLAKNIGMSFRNFKRRFKQATGWTPLNYIHRLRVEKAKQLLETTNTTIQEISYQVGYEDSSFFCRLFKRHTSQTPSSYRNQSTRIMRM